MSKLYRYEYWDVSCPAEAYANKAQREEGAILQAREQCKIYRMPANWYASKIIDSETVRVCRVTRKGK